VSHLWGDLTWRGLVHQSTDPELAALLDQRGLTGYVGFDPTAPSLHVGSLQQILLLVRLQQAGHAPVALAGGGTGLVGDPSFRADERPLLTSEELAAHLDGIRSQLERFLDFSAGAGSARARLVDNGEWLGQLRLLDFLRDVGKHFTVNAMMAKESVRARLQERDQGISFTEFTYMLLQAFDFLHLFETYDCRLQLGGSDQWGNITMGIDLIRRLHGVTAYGLTSPLVVKADGSKFGKTESGTVWLDAERTSPYALYQYFVRTEDSAVGDYLRRLTLLSRETILELDSAVATRPERREAQRALAAAVTTLVHGAEEARRAERAAEVLFSEEIASLDEPTLVAALGDAPSTDLSRSDLGRLDVVDALVRTELVSSKGAARRAVQQGGVYVNNRRVDGVEATIGVEDLLHDRYVILRRGRKDQHVLRFG